MVGGRGRWVALAAAALAVLAGAETAAAGTSTARDGNDRPGRLDIRTASQGHAGSRVTHTIRTFGRWPTALLGPSTPNYFLLVISTDSDPAPERLVLIVSTPGRLIAGVLNPRGRLLGRAAASRPNARTAKVSIRRSLLGNPAGYRWQAFAYYRGSNTCGGGCLDRAPNRSRVLHDLAAPSVSFTSASVPSLEEYDLQFTVGDAGGSGTRSWRLEHRPFDGPSWTELDSGSTSGPQSHHHVGMQGETDVFRVVARDWHGNVGVSQRVVSVPFDNSNPSLAYAGTWSHDATAAGDFLDTLSRTSDLNATMTHQFTGRYVAVVAPAGTASLGGQMNVYLDELHVATIYLDLLPNGHRRIVWSQAFPGADAHEIRLQDAFGTFELDGIIVR
jgi:hypothetical protein